MFFVALGVLGIVLPLMPTTVFLLLAAACFARSSPRMYDWLLHHPSLGPLIRGWREHRRIPARAKRLAIALIVVTFSVSIYWVSDNAWGRLALVAIATVLVMFIARIPALEAGSPQRPPPP